ncbi:MAG: diaminopimelate epimerase [Candidatus Cloacimonetes bacterium HGW-Cloacimonetes-1]|jgi:diaminopimelate epimerase|nr:MAG: diaminopimelate epimerase [Candidatus Cloacimonetes bacterium HGW-Cloacimonetes-1]
MLIPFIKMHAQGNDFVILDGFESAQTDLVKLAIEVCKPHFGIGADGLVLIKPSAGYDGRMVIYNSDGSTAEMCGSALRCVTHLLFQKTGKTEMLIETESGVKKGKITGNGETVEVNIGRAISVEDNISVEGQAGSLIDVGNLHYVVYANDLSDDPHLKYGWAIEHNPHFPKTVNVQYTQKINEDRIVLKIWENACGPTLACGTGACSAVAVGRKHYGLSDTVTVQMPGGEVVIKYDSIDDSYWLCGGVKEAFRGEYLWKI